MIGLEEVCHGLSIIFIQRVSNCSMYTWHQRCCFLQKLSLRYIFNINVFWMFPLKMWLCKPTRVNTPVLPGFIWFRHTLCSGNGDWKCLERVWAFKQTSPHLFRITRSMLLNEIYYQSTRFELRRLSVDFHQQFINSARPNTFRMW